MRPSRIVFCFDSTHTRLIWSHCDELTYIKTSFVVKENHLEVEEQDQLYLDITHKLHNSIAFIMVNRVNIFCCMDYLEARIDDIEYYIHQKVSLSHHKQVLSNSLDPGNRWRTVPPLIH